MNSLAFPPARRLSGAVRVPPSKSATNRALVLAALSRTPVQVIDPLDAEDPRALLACLETMGARVSRVSGGISLHGPLSGGRDVAVLDAKDSGTAARFLLAVAAATGGEFRVTGSKRLCERPMGELFSALRSLGAGIREEGASGCLPVLVSGGKLSGGSVAVDASRSSQFLSALMLAGAAGVDIEVRASGPVASAPYAALTAETLRAFGHGVDGAGPWRVSRGVRSPERYEIPGDFSSAIPLLAAVGAAGGDILLEGLTWPSPEADAGAVPVLEKMGVRISAERGGLAARADSRAVAAVQVVAADFPDAVPALAALAVFAPGESRFDGIAHLRFKESDRLASLADILGRAGALASAEGGALVVRGGLAGRASASLPTFRDHRMAMAAGVLAVGRPGVRIEDPDCVGKSYPGFFRDLDSLCER
ncbi:MAG: 3-phosphoshikimate 1-carboxyvinyltransferase [Acidobacteriota bacterium]